jgi:dienelactone hydrolase
MRRWGVIGLTLLMGATAELFPEFRRPPEKKFPALPAFAEASDSASWEKRRAELRSHWDRILGPLPPRGPISIQVVSTEELPDHSRLLIRYDDGSGEAYLLLPRESGKRPAVVCLHPTSKTNLRDPVGLANRESVHHALHLVRRGYVCIAPRNFLWAEEGRAYQQSADALLKRGEFKTGMAKMLWDAMRAVDVLRERPEVDAARIGAIGHSLGGKEALHLAAFDERIAAAVSCEGGVGLGFSNWDADWYLGPQIRSPDFGHDNHEVMALVAPRALLIIGGESADGARTWPYIKSCLPVWRLYDAEDRLGLLRHQHKHDFPPPGPQRDQVYSWLDHWLKEAEVRP